MLAADLHFIFVSSFLIFVLLLFFICRCLFIYIFFLTSSFTLPWTIAEFLNPFNTFSPVHRRVICDTFIFNYSIIFLSQALQFWVDIFYPQVFFTLRSFTNILTCIYQGFPGSRQFFLGVCRTSYWSSKHRPSSSVCLIHSNPQSSIFITIQF